eukprot:CAMPEP_0201539964 /NCGR_PEP_ID=MMETSP0161_2-20130828/70689_1 /ASSEMBLY_ACC=CAM_ASM_000251 /TAXON_ID=180227 /ORGANISM="Neoparamoeba aestuarina, Strain SoJaBio B1-5/56/2" /LENGTH=319 /DNA_ID=CAMNT_0047947395 /DNA_START=1428 /DNA_END=2387 /DNA_ORIENTATION=-
MSFHTGVKGIFHQISHSFAKDKQEATFNESPDELSLAPRNPEKNVNLSLISINERITSDDGKSNVYACTVDGWQCAVKSLSLEGITPQEVDSFVSEIKILESLPTHPNLVRYLFHETSPSLVRLFMRRYYGNLTKYLQKREDLEEILTLKDIVSIGKDIAVGLEVLHTHQIIHRYLVTENILVTLNGMGELTCCSIGDLASARKLKRKSRKASGQESLFPSEVAAPEALENGISSTAMDIWSLGVILYELLMTARQDAFPYPPTASLLSTLSTSPLPFAYDENEYKPIVDVMKHCLSNKPKKRPTAGELKNTLLHLSVM